MESIFQSIIHQFNFPFQSFNYYLSMNLMLIRIYCLQDDKERKIEKNFRNKNLLRFDIIFIEKNAFSQKTQNHLYSNKLVMYPKDQVSSHPEEFIISEIIREKILLKTNEEVPHSVAVVVEEMKPMDENQNALSIRANIYVERQSQKKIIIGKQGAMIKEIGTLARKEIVMLLGQKVYLELWVKVEDDWRNKKSTLRRMGYFLEN